MKRSKKTQRHCSAACGFMLLAGGLVLLGMKLGWIPEEFLQSIPFIPLAMVIMGTFMLVSAIVHSHGNNNQADDFWNCCSGRYQSKEAMK